MSVVTDKAICAQCVVSADKMRHKDKPTPSVTHRVFLSLFLLRLYLQTQTKYMESPKADVPVVSH